MTACLICGNEITGDQSLKKYCSHQCYKKVQRNQYDENFQGWHRSERPASTVGATHELMVCADLMKRGYHVFRAQSPACPCDIVVLTEDKSKTYLVEVTTGNKNKNGGISYPKKNERYKYDIMAVVFHDGEIKYLQGGLEYTP